MSRPRLAILAAVLATVSVALPARGQDWTGQGRLQGVVQDPDGNPLEGATVELVNPDRGGGPTVTTDDKGKWAYLGLAAGRWRIDVTKDGYVTTAHRVQMASERSRIPPIRTTLEPAGPPPPPPELMEFLDEADALYQQEDYAAARAAYESALETYTTMAAFDPESEEARTFLSEIHMQIARCYSQVEDYEKELEHLEYVMEADPDNVDVRLIAAQEAIRGGMMERGAEIFAEIETSDVDDPALFFNIAVLYLNQGDQAAAIPYLTRAVEVDPGFVDGYYQRALARFATGQLDEARADCEKVIELVGDGEQAATARALIEAIDKQQSAGAEEGD